MMKDDNAHKICIFGGASLYRLPLYNLMAEAFDCDFYITRFSDGRDNSIKTYNFSELKNYKGINTLKPLFGKFNWNTSIWGLFRKPYTTYVVAGAWDLSSWLLIFLCSFTHKRVVSWSHGLYGREKGLRLLIKVLFFKSCSKCIVYNERSRDLILTNGLKPENVVSVHNSLDHNTQVTLRNNHSDIYIRHFGYDAPVLFFIGRLIEDKQIDLLLSASELLLKNNFVVNIVIIGDGPERNKLEMQVENAGIKSHVWFYGPCYDESEKSVLIGNSDLCVTPGAIGLTCIDSLTYGTPVITKDDLNYQGPEYAAIREGKTGAFFKTNDVEDLANKIKEWIENSPDREEIRKNCYEEIDNYWTPEYEVEQLKQVLTGDN